MKRREILFLMTIIALTCTGCDVIKEDDRILEVEKIIPLKRVLLLDFTDQGCINCLRATEEIQNLLDIYNDTLIAVSIHASPRSFSLVTDDGNEYDKHFKVTRHPTGIIDGVFSSSSPQLWGGFVWERYKLDPALNIELSVSLEKETRELKTISRITGLAEHSGLKLLLWVIENKIIDRQLMLDGKYKLDYEHNHVFRAAINGRWGGDAFSIHEYEEQTFENSYILNDHWHEENISIVGFVYNINSNEVLSVTEIKLVNNESD
jgi:hypothetical protein